MRDKAHASRRILQRPQKADEYINATLDTFVLNKHSMVQRIAHSDELRRQFEMKVKEVDAECDSHIKNLRAAKHRFESIAKPTGRYVLWHDCFLDVAQWMLVARAGRSEGEDARRFLREVDEENCIQIAMHADFADDCLCLTRCPLV